MDSLLSSSVRTNLAGLFATETLDHKISITNERATLKVERFKDTVARDATSRISLFDFFGNEADPDPMAKHGDVHKERKFGPLYVDGISPNDVRQGELADCYFAAAAGAIAKANPQAISDAISDHGDGTYTVRFFDDNGKPVYINVDHELYVDNTTGATKYGKSTQPNELWYPILEKAYAKWKGGYENIGNGGNIGQVMHAITGNWTNAYGNDNTDANTMWAKINQGVNNNKPIAAWTATSPDGKKGKQMDATGIASSHCYTVVGAELDGNGTRWVVIRNPWGNGEAKNTGYQTDVDADHNGALDGDDGTFRITIEDFQKNYVGVEIGK